MLEFLAALMLAIAGIVAFAWIAIFGLIVGPVLVLVEFAVRDALHGTTAAGIVILAIIALSMKK